MGSKKRSAWQKQKAEFAASLGGMDDLFASENARSQRHDEERAAALRHKACERKNRYASRYEAELTAAPTATAGTSLRRGSRAAGTAGSFAEFRIFRRVSQLSQRGEGGCCTVIPFFGQRGGLSVWRVGS